MVSGSFYVFQRDELILESDIGNDEVIGFFASMVNSPFASVTTFLAVPEMVMVAPADRLPLLSVTFSFERREIRQQRFIHSGRSFHRFLFDGDGSAVDLEIDGLACHHFAQECFQLHILC